MCAMFQVVSFWAGLITVSAVGNLLKYCNILEELNYTLASPLQLPIATGLNFRKGTSRTSQPRESDNQIIALLANRQLIVVDAKNGVLRAKHSLSKNGGPPYEEPGHFIARSKNGKKIFALVPGGRGEPDQLAVMDLPTNQIASTHVLDNNCGVFRSLDVGSVTGSIFLFGNRDRVVGLESSVVVTMLHPGSGKVLANWTARELEPYDWWVYQGIVSADERRLFISYHGAAQHGKGTSGIDWFEISGKGLLRCPLSRDARPGVACVPSHGGVALYGDGILAATGGSIILEIDRAGRIRRGFDTQQKRTHLMEFVVDDIVNRLFALGPCDYVSGFSVIDLTTSGRPVVMEADGLKLESTPSEAPVASTTLGPCGDRVAFGMNSLLVIARSGGLDFLDVRTGKILQTIKTSSRPIDVLVTPCSLRLL